jgi:pimeloyl-ACP methyl ester carboxylesterase
VSTTSDLTELIGWSDRTRPLDTRDLPAASGPPALRLALGELLAGGQAYRLAVALRRLRAAPRAPWDGAPVVDVPGFAAPESLMTPLRSYVAGLGHDARGWGFGRNRGDVGGDVRRLARLVLDRADADGPVALVGWSLGGVVAREVARLHPDAVRRVITFGTPVVGGTAHTTGARFVRRADADRLAAYAEHRDRTHPIRVPVTVVLSRRDGVVEWRSCLDHHSTHVDHVEVRSTHLGMVVDPDVWLTVARRLSL